MNSPTLDPDVIAVDEEAAAAVTGISTSSLQKMRMRGDGPVYAKIGQRVRYRPCDLRAYVERHLVTSTSATAQA